MQVHCNQFTTEQFTEKTLHRRASSPQSDLPQPIHRNFFKDEKAHLKAIHHKNFTVYFLSKIFHRKKSKVGKGDLEHLSISLAYCRENHFINVEKLVIF
jgi:hypothetical protein